MTDPLPRRDPAKRKHCPACGRDLPVNDFGFDATRKDDRRGVCRACRNRRDRERREGRAAPRRPWAGRFSLRKMAIAAGVPDSTVRDRLRRGWGLERALGKR